MSRGREAASWSWVCSLFEECLEVLHGSLIYELEIEFMGHNRASENRKKRLKRQKRREKFSLALAYFETLTTGKINTKMLAGLKVNRQKKRKLQEAQGMHVALMSLAPTVKAEVVQDEPVFVQTPPEEEEIIPIYV